MVRQGLPGCLQASEFGVIAALIQMIADRIFSQRTVLQENSDARRAALCGADYIVRIAGGAALRDTTIVAALLGGIQRLRTMNQADVGLGVTR